MRPIIRQQNMAWLGLGAMTLAVLVVGLASHTRVPLYDGVGFPDEAYRYITPPRDTRPTAQATSCTEPYTLTNGTNPNLIFCTTAELGPQAQVAISDHRLSVVPTGSDQLQLSLTPLAPGALASGSLTGNVYRVAAVVAGATVKFIGQDESSLVALRLPQAASTQGLTIIYRSGEGQDWQTRPISQIGSDIYSTRFTGFGDYALANLATKPKPVPKRDHRWLWVSLVVICVIVIVAGWLWLWRHYRRQSNA